MRKPALPVPPRANTFRSIIATIHNKANKPDVTKISFSNELRLDFLFIFGGGRTKVIIMLALKREKKPGIIP